MPLESKRRSLRQTQGGSRFLLEENVTGDGVPYLLRLERLIEEVAPFSIEAEPTRAGLVVAAWDKPFLVVAFGSQRDTGTLYRFVGDLVVETSTWNGRPNSAREVARRGGGRNISEVALQVLARLSDQ